jgi:hypothetical protein
MLLECFQAASLTQKELRRSQVSAIGEVNKIRSQEEEETPPGYPDLEQSEDA